MRQVYYIRSQAEQEFVDWLDSVSPPVEQGRPKLNSNVDHARIKFEKKEGHRHRYLMKNSYWYRSMVAYHEQQEEATEIALLEGKQYQEPEPIANDDPTFWDQF